MKIKIQGMIIIILAVLLLFAGGYILRMKWNERDAALFQSGARYGYEQSILQLMKEAAKCQPVPVFADGGNLTMHLVATECYQQQSQPQGTQTSIKSVLNASK